jgi:fatty aldehyde decarbonylase
MAMPSLRVVGSDAQIRAVWADVLSQAVTGELVGALNYASMAAICPTVEEQLLALANADEERRHALGFRGLARELGVPVLENPRANYWGRIRDAFGRLVASGDVLGCLIAQEVVLESFAVSLYRAVARATDGALARVFRRVADDEEVHLEHAIERLASARRADPAGFDAKAGQVHREVMSVLAEMVTSRDTGGHCGLCRDACVKDSLHLVGLSARVLRGQALRAYLQSLDRLALPGETSLAWVANLPA